MSIEISPLSIILAAALLSAIGSLLWAAGRSLLNQYGALLRDQLSEHRSESNQRHEQIVRRLDAFEAALDADTARIARLEHVVETAPSHDDLKRIHARTDNVITDLGSLSGDIKGLVEKVGGMGGTLALIHEFMLHNKK